MYSRQEATQLRKEFWTSLGQYMSPVLSAEGERISWLNYKTGEKGIHFRMSADNKTARIAVELTQPDPGIQQLYFQQFEAFRRQLHAQLGEEWTWQLQGHDEHGRPVAAIYKELPGVSVFQRNDWPALISFFKPRLVALDAFWSEVKYAFEELR